MEQREKELDDAGEALHDTFETPPATMAKAEAKAKTQRQFGTSGAQLAAALRLAQAAVRRVRHWAVQSTDDRRLERHDSEDD
eukprot:9415863-Pyramimonas_sp.AAC.1